MATDLSAFLADLVADVVTEIESITDDPFVALDDALETQAKAEGAKTSWLRRTSQRRSEVTLTVAGRYACGYETYLAQVGDALAQGLDEVPGNRHYLQGKINEAAKPFAREYHRLLAAINDADRQVEAVRASIDMSDLPIGTLVKFITKSGDDGFWQVGIVAKVTDASYTCELQDWHPQHQKIWTNDSVNARIDRVKGPKDYRYGGGRSLSVIGSPDRGDTIKAKVTEVAAAKAAATLFEQKVSQAGRDAKSAYDRDVQAQTDWDHQFRNSGNEALATAQRQVLEKYAAEVQALATMYTVRKREALGTRPEVTVHKVTGGYYFHDFATPEEKAELARLTAEAERLDREVRTA